jgi:hypothetical protein
VLPSGQWQPTPPTAGPSSSSATAAVEDARQQTVLPSPTRRPRTAVDVCQWLIEVLNGLILRSICPESIQAWTFLDFPYLSPKLDGTPPLILGKFNLGMGRAFFFLPFVCGLGAAGARF